MGIPRNVEIAAIVLVNRAEEVVITVDRSRSSLRAISESVVCDHVSKTFSAIC